MKRRETWEKPVCSGWHLGMQAMVGFIRVVGLILTFPGVV